MTFKPKGVRRKTAERLIVLFANQSEKEYCYYLPEDGVQAKIDLLKQFDSDNLKEIYIKAYALNSTDLLAKIKTTDTKGIPVYILADYVQARGQGSWNKLADLHNSLKHGELLLATAGVNSPSTGQIWHSKAITFVYKNTQSAINWEGSVNFSDSGFVQGNTARLFASKDWSSKFIEHFNVHRDWALSNAKNKQIDYLLNNPVQTESLEFSEDNAEAIYQIDLLKKQNHKYKLWLYSLVFIVIIQWLIFSQMRH